MTKLNDMIKQLDQDELDYAAMASKLGPSVLPVLLKIVRGDDVGRAAKATYLASLIAGPEQEAIITAAAESDSATVRVAAAGSAKNLKKVPVEVLEGLLGDNDDGVRRLAVRTAGESKVAGLKAKLQAMAQGDPQEHLREAASKVFAQLK